MPRRIAQEINAGSMADIAFLLLIFFLVTTTMGTDMGIIRKLPPITVDPGTAPIKKRNLLEVLVNRNNILMLRGETIELADLREKAKEFILNKENKSDLPEFEIVEIPLIGNYAITNNHVISLQNDRGTSYKTYITVQNELAAAYNELRNEFAINRWGEKYENLDADKREAVEAIYPMHISEAEPRVAEQQ